MKLGLTVVSAPVDFMPFTAIDTLFTACELTCSKRQNIIPMNIYYDERRDLCMSDAEILDLYWAGSPKAVIAAKEKYDSECYSLALEFFDDDLMASEAVMKAYKAVCNEIPPNRPKNLKLFLLSMTRNAAIDLLFSNYTVYANEKISQIDKEMSAWSLDTPLSDLELGAIIDSFLRTLTDIEQIMFVCRYWYFDSVSAISEYVNLPEAKILSVLRSLGEKLLARFMEVERIIEK